MNACPKCGLKLRDINGNIFCDNCNEYVCEMDLLGETREQLKKRIEVAVDLINMHGFKDDSGVLKAVKRALIGWVKS